MSDSRILKKDEKPKKTAKDFEAGLADKVILYSREIRYDLVK